MLQLLLHASHTMKHWYVLEKKDKGSLTWWSLQSSEKDGL